VPLSIAPKFPIFCKLPCLFVRVVRRFLEACGIKRVDLIVLGGGLAGCALAWQAHFRGMNVALIDRGEPKSSSRIAAGLVTPITGNRAALSWRWDEFYGPANHFYREVERATESNFWTVEPAIKLYESHAERELYEKRWLQPDTTVTWDDLPMLTPLPDVATMPELTRLNIPFDGCQMSPAARLKPSHFLDSSYRYFKAIGAMYEADIDCSSHLRIQNGQCEIEALNLSGDHIALCQGIASRENTYFDRLALHPARGDILEVASDTLECERVIHGNGWIVPIGNRRYLLGATYDRDLSSLESPQAIVTHRDDLLQRWAQMVTKSPSGAHDVVTDRVVDHRTAIRPASYDRHPLIGQHPQHKQVFCLNGLGSKGTLMAPWLASCLLDSMRGHSIPKFFDWQRKIL
jgi:glycine/D-amino acid oxidase-like deaminating enzyme